VDSYRPVDPNRPFGIRLPPDAFGRADRAGICATGCAIRELAHGSWTAHRHIRVSHSTPARGISVTAGCDSGQPPRVSPGVPLPLAARRPGETAERWNILATETGNQDPERPARRGPGCRENLPAGPRLSTGLVNQAAPAGFCLTGRFDGRTAHGMRDLRGLETRAVNLVWRWVYGEGFQQGHEDAPAGQGPAGRHAGTRPARVQARGLDSERSAGRQSEHMRKPAQ